MLLAIVNVRRMFHTKSDVKINQYVSFNHLVLELSDTRQSTIFPLPKNEIKVRSFEPRSLD